jgi:putative transcriptional regulator
MAHILEKPIGAMRKELFDELLESVKQAAAIERGEMKPSRVFIMDKKNEVSKARAKLGLSQNKFAALLGISSATLKNWEQGRRHPPDQKLFRAPWGSEYARPSSPHSGA